MSNKKIIEKIVQEHGFDSFGWIAGKDVQVRQWVRVKCMFGCASYGKKGTCPPQVPSLDECREFFSEYDHLLILHFKEKFNDPKDRIEWSRKNNLRLLPLERAVFLAGYPKAFTLSMDECRLCKSCSGTREDCINLSEARPSPESFGVDVFSTVSSASFPICVLTDYTQEMNRYAFLLVE